MNELENLDQRAHRAAADVRSRAADRPRPTFDASDASLLPAPARLEDHRPRRSLLAAAAVILLVLAGGLAFVTRHQGGDGDGPASPTTSTEPPRPFVATTLPKGMAFSGAVGASSTVNGPQPFGPLSVFGTEPARPELGVGVLRISGSDLIDAKSVEIDGRTVLAYDQQGVGERAVLVRRGQRVVLAMSPSLDRATLARVAEATKIDGDEPKVADDSLPDGFRLLTREPSPTGPDVGVFRGGSAHGPSTLYMAGAGVSDGSGAAGGLVTLESSSGDEARLQSIRLWSDDTSETTVRGHPALVTSSVFPGSPTDEGMNVRRVVTWIERPGELLRVSGFGVTEDELEALAEGVRPVPAAEWASLVERTELGEFSDAANGVTSTAVGAGRFGDGTAWRLAMEESGSAGGIDPEKFMSPRLSVALGGDGDSSSGSSTGTAQTDAAFVATQTLDKGGRHFVAGTIGRAVATVELRRADGSVIETAAIVEGGGYRGWVAELTEDPTIVVALTADGRELDRVSFSDLGGNESPQISEGSAPTTVVSGNAGGTGTGGSDGAPDQPGSAPRPVLPGD